jgi:hypothetical protein
MRFGTQFLAVFLVVGLAFTGCASLGGARHVATFTVSTSGTVLDALQDTEMLLVCGRTNAPTAPLCVDANLHKQISGKLAQAYGLHKHLTELVLAVPAGAPQPAEVSELLGRIAAIVNDVLALIPEGSPQKASLVAHVTAAQ